MTIFGVAAGRDHATVWADTLMTTDGVPLRHASKIVINPLAGAIGVSAGSVAILDEGDRALIESDSLDAALPKIASALRSAAMSMVKRGHDRRPSWFVRNVYVAVGWLSAQERIAAFEFAAADLFEPRQVTVSVHPHVEITFCGGRMSNAEVLDAAARQTTILRAREENVGRLCVATITPHGIVALVPTDLPARANITDFAAPDDAEEAAADSGQRCAGRIADPAGAAALPDVVLETMRDS